jgi:hypothetical protein
VPPAAAVECPDFGSLTSQRTLHLMVSFHHANNTFCMIIITNDQFQSNHKTPPLISTTKAQSFSWVPLFHLFVELKLALFGI